MTEAKMESVKTIGNNESTEGQMDVCDGSNCSKLLTTVKKFNTTIEKENQNLKQDLVSSQKVNTLNNEAFSLPDGKNNSLQQTTQGNNSNERRNSVWTVKSPMLVRPRPNIFAVRRKSNENYAQKQYEEQPMSVDKSNTVLRSGLDLIDASPSAFTRKPQGHTPSFMDVDLDGNMLKRCNSAPILNDSEGSSVEWSRPVASTAGRIRRFSANIVSQNSSPASNVARSRLRLYQLKKEESLEAIQTKEAEHEREVQTTLQISSNYNDLSLGDRRSSIDDSSSPRTVQSPSLPARSQFPTPQSSVAGVRSAYSRAIDFNTAGSGQIGHHATSGGIPSPLTFSSSASFLNISPLPPSPTRGICGPGKQCFSPSMHIPVCLTSRSPSPSPTRRTFVTRRRSQSPCIMRPSALGPIKRKYDSDSEGSCSPKRAYLSTSTATSASGDTSSVTSSTPAYRTLVHRSHSLSSSSIDSSDIYVSPSPPHQVTTFITTHHHSSHHPTGFIHPLQYSLSPLSNIPVSSSSTDSSNRSSSPTNSTCSSSSLEGLSLTMTSQRQQVVAAKKDVVAANRI